MTQWGLDNLFNPGKRHMDDEKRRLQSTREEVGDNSGGRRIDLEGGRVSIAVPGGARRSAPADDDAATAPDDGVLDAALEAEDLPAVALASDAEIEPEIVQEPEPEPVQPEAVAPEAVVPEPVAPEAVVPEPAVPEVEASTVERDPAPASEPPAPRRRAVSASVWSRQG